MSDIEELGAGYSLRLKDNDDGGTRVTLVEPDGEERIVVGGYEWESPEDMIWRRRLEDIFRVGLDAGIAIGKSLAPVVGAEGGENARTDDLPVGQETEPGPGGDVSDGPARASIEEDE